MKKREQIYQFLDERLGLTDLRMLILDRKMPSGIGWIYTLGSLSLFLFVVQAITGILLAMNYSSSPEHAYQSVRYIMENVSFGPLLRSLHKWGATAMIVAVVIHMTRIYFMGAYKYPRELTWILGVFLLLITLAFGFTGYLLPWDQKAYWATEVGTNLIGQAPFLGPYLIKILRGGDELGAATLSRFYAFHILVLPALLTLLTVVHIYVVIRLGISNPPEKGRRWGAEWQKEQHADYLEKKAHGESFYPFTLSKDAIAAFAVLCLLIVLSLLYPADLELRADPSDSHYNPRPEWYFLFYFQFLKYFPGSMEALAAIILPTVAILVMILLPFLDSGPARHPFERPVWTGLGIFSLVAVGWLTWAGYRSPRYTEPSVDPAVAEGKRLYQELGCRHCHTLDGRGGIVGPDLTGIGERRTADWLKNHFVRPAQGIGNSSMPRYTLLKNELENLTAYMSSLKAAKEEHSVFEQNCAGCHSFRGHGGSVGPDLSDLIHNRDADYISRYIENPSNVKKDTEMPAFGDTLTKEDKEALIRMFRSTTSK